MERSLLSARTDGLRIYPVISCLVGILVLTACGGGAGSSGGGVGGNRGGGSGGSPPPNYPGNRTLFVRTGDIPSSAVFDSLHKMVFAAEPDLGLVDAISIPGGQIVARIPVPGVEAVGISSDNTRILASGNVQRVAWIDTAGLQVINWQMLPPVTPPGSNPQFWVPDDPYCILPNFANSIDLPSYTANPYLLANGKVLFEASVGPFFPGATVEWDPAANTATYRNDLPGGGFVSTNTSGTEVFFAGGPSFYDSATDSVRNFGGVLPFTTILAAGNSAGTQFAIYSGTNITFVDNQFNIVGQAPLAAANSNQYQPTGLVYSPDGTRLYVVTPGVLPIITTIDATNFSVLGTAPAFATTSLQSPQVVENPLTADGTGLVVGSALGGLVFDDSTDYHTFSQNDPGLPGLTTPAEGPVQGGTVATVTVELPASIPAIWFGSQLATKEDASALPLVKATTPPAKSAGTVDVKAIEPNGVIAMIPQGFTYGSVPLLTAPLAIPSAGHVAADIYGFGYSADSAAAAQEVTIGTGGATVISATQADGIPVQDLHILIPLGFRARRIS